MFHAVVSFHYVSGLQEVKINDLHKCMTEKCTVMSKHVYIAKSIPQCTASAF